MIKFQQSQALTSHFESFWSVVLGQLKYFSFRKVKTGSGTQCRVYSGCKN